MLLTVIPHYNSSDLLRYTLDSIAKGSRRPDKVIIVDDGSNFSESNSLLHLVDCFKEDLNIVLDLRSLNEGLVKIREYVWSTYVRELKPNYFHFWILMILFILIFTSKGCSLMILTKNRQYLVSLSVVLRNQ